MMSESKHLATFPPLLGPSPEAPTVYVHLEVNNTRLDPPIVLVVGQALVIEATANGSAFARLGHAPWSSDE
jgi:hypothetical protein